MKFKETQPWKFLDEFRGKEFEGQWPDIKTMFHISCLRYPDNLCFRAFSPKEETFTYKEAEKKMVFVNKAAEVLGDPQKKALYDRGEDPDNPGFRPNDGNNQQQNKLHNYQSKLNFLNKNL